MGFFNSHDNQNSMYMHNDKARYIYASACLIQDVRTILHSIMHYASLH